MSNDQTRGRPSQDLEQMLLVMAALPEWIVAPDDAFRTDRQMMSFPYVVAVLIYREEVVGTLPEGLNALVWKLALYQFPCKV